MWRPYLLGSEMLSSFVVRCFFGREAYRYHLLRPAVMWQQYFFYFYYIYIYIYIFCCSNSLSCRVLLFRARGLAIPPLAACGIADFTTDFTYFTTQATLLVFKV
jgi:hypothetical protein